MITLNKPINLIKWNYKFSNIEDIFGDSARIETVYSINTNNNGFLSYSPSSNFNSLQFLEPAKSYLVVLKSNSYTFLSNSPAIQLDERHSYTKGIVDMVKYGGETIPINDLPEDYLAQYKNIYTLNLNNNGWISYSIPQAFSSQSITFNTLTDLKTDSIYIIEKKNTDEITFSNTIDKFPRNKNSFTGPTFCKAPLIWKINNNNESFCSEKLCDDIEGQISFECLNIDNPSYANCIYCEYDGVPGGPPFFDPVDCICKENCENVINNLSPCPNGNQRNPETCECCEEGRVPCGTQCVIDDCALSGLDPTINSMVMNTIGYPKEEDSCYCECTGGDDLCQNIGYDEMFYDIIETTDKYGNVTFIRSTCSFPNDCACREGREFGPVILPDGTVINKCRSIVPYGACCDGRTCVENYEENCIGGVFYRDLSCLDLAQPQGGGLGGEPLTPGDCPVCVDLSDENKQQYICDNALDGDENGCVYCDINQFFNPITCTCHNNCVDIIDDLPPCAVGNRNPNNCLCCPNNDPDTNNIDPNLPSDRIGEESFGYSPCLNDCAYCVNRSPLDEGSLSWNETLCKCQCSANESCVEQGKSSFTIFNEEDCSCECPEATQEYCNTRGYQFNSISCRCTCNDDIRRGKCPKIPFNGKDRWDSDKCECNCAQDPNNPRIIFEPCTSEQIRNPDSCQCECPDNISTECVENEDFNPLTCACEPRKLGSWCVGQFCPLNTFERVNGKLVPFGTFYTTGCQEGSFIDWLAGDNKNQVQQFRENTSCVDSEELGCVVQQIPSSCTTTTTPAPTTTTTTTTTTTPAPTTTTTVSPSTSTTPTPTSTTSAPNNEILVDAQVVCYDEVTTEEKQCNSSEAPTHIKFITAIIEPFNNESVTAIEVGFEKTNMGECCSEATFFKNDIQTYSNFRIQNTKPPVYVAISGGGCDSTTPPITTTPEPKWKPVGQSTECKRTCELLPCEDQECYNTKEICECGENNERCIEGNYCLIDASTGESCTECCQESCLNHYTILEDIGQAKDWEEGMSCSPISSQAINPNPTFPSTGIINTESKHCLPVGCCNFTRTVGGLFVTNIKVSTTEAECMRRRASAGDTLGSWTADPKVPRRPGGIYDKSIFEAIQDCSGHCLDFKIIAVGDDSSEVCVTPDGVPIPPGTIASKTYQYPFERNGVTVLATITVAFECRNAPAGSTYGKQLWAWRDKTCDTGYELTNIDGTCYCMEFNGDLWDVTDAQPAIWPPDPVFQ